MLFMNPLEWVKATIKAVANLGGTALIADATMPGMSFNFRVKHRVNGSIAEFGRARLLLLLPYWADLYPQPWGITVLADGHYGDLYVHWVHFSQECWDTWGGLIGQVTKDLRIGRLLNYSDGERGMSDFPRKRLITRADHEAAWEADTAKHESSIHTDWVGPQPVRLDEEAAKRIHARRKAKSAKASHRHDSAKSRTKAHSRAFSNKSVERFFFTDPSKDTDLDNISRHDDVLLEDKERAAFLTITQTWDDADYAESLGYATC